jgi:hypothetical protein
MKWHMWSVASSCFHFHNFGSGSNYFLHTAESDMGADTKRKKIVDAGGITALLGMLETAFDDDTRREAVKALGSLSPYGM